MLEDYYYHCLSFIISALHGAYKLQACKGYYYYCSASCKLAEIFTTFIYLKYLNSIAMVAEVIIITFAFVNTWALQAAEMH